MNNDDQIDIQRIDFMERFGAQMASVKQLNNEQTLSKLPVFMGRRWLYCILDLKSPENISSTVTKRIIFLKS